MKKSIPASGLAWFHLIRGANRTQLLHPNVGRRRRVRLMMTLRERLPGRHGQADHIWTTALSALGVEWSHRTTADPDDLAALERFFGQMLDPSGRWLMPIDKVDHAMKGYSLLYLAKVTKDSRYSEAAHELAASLLSRQPRAPDGCMYYHQASGAILVDTLAMICPFLARYANQYGQTEAMQLSTLQLVQYVRTNMDPGTHLPYHGYYADGPSRLGLHGWGRGTGWYMMGLVDTLAEISPEQDGYSELAGAYTAAAESLLQFQRPDGHWNWAIPHRSARYDSSTTSLLAYGLARGCQIGLLGASFQSSIESAMDALVRVTRPDGLLEGGSAECRDLGQYPQHYGPRLWLQGSATAFAALYFAPQLSPVGPEGGTLPDLQSKS